MIRTDSTASCPQKKVKQLLRDISFVCKQLAIQTFSKDFEYFRILIADICASKYECYNLTSVIARQMQLEAMAPSHGPLAVCCYSLEHLVGVTPQIVAYRNHCGIHKCNACASAEGTEVEEEHEREEHATFKFNKAVVRYNIGEI